jgi:prolyl-tRNA synthetase
MTTPPRNVKLISKFLFQTLKESQISEMVQFKSSELLERAGYIRKVIHSIQNGGVIK